MDEFFLYKQVCDLAAIAQMYTQGQKMASTLRKTAEDISSRTYRAAVIGEFKRGKSSLLNALLGSSVLPTDVLPMTAAVTRIRYGTRRSITVLYRNGTSEEKSLEELVYYATKLDLQKAQTARQVSEIVVTYPSVLCKNHIEILDTPGLNDNETMSETTLSVIGDVDAAIVAMSVNEPCSLTEQELVLDLLNQDGIRHLVFAITFLDTLRNDKERDKMLSFITNRISTEILERAEQRFRESPEKLKKARNLLSNPQLFGVSAQMAMEAFDSGDPEALEESRLPIFKERLLTILTAAQTEDVVPKSLMAARQTIASLPDWFLDEEALSAARIQEINRTAGRIMEYQTQSRDPNAPGSLINKLLELDCALGSIPLMTRNGIDIGQVSQKAVPIFARKLGSLTAQTNTDAHIRRCLSAGKMEARGVIMDATYEAASKTDTQMALVAESFQKTRVACGFDPDSLPRKLEQWRQANPVPQFTWTVDPIPQGQLVNVNVMMQVISALRQSLEAYNSLLHGRYLAWRVVLLQQNQEDLERCSIEMKALQEGIQAEIARRNAMRFLNPQHMCQVKEILHHIEQASS